MAVAKATAAPAPIEPIEIKRPKLPIDQPREEGHTRRRFFIKAPANATIEDARYPEFWGGISKWLTRHDIIFLLAADESWEAEIRIEGVRMTGADVSVSKVYSRTPIKHAMTMLGDDFCTEYRVDLGWCVVRVSDRMPIVSKHSTEASAMLEWQRIQPRRG